MLEGSFSSSFPHTDYCRVFPCYHFFIERLIISIVIERRTEDEISSVSSTGLHVLQLFAQRGCVRIYRSLKASRSAKISCRFSQTSALILGSLSADNKQKLPRISRIPRNLSAQIRYDSGVRRPFQISAKDLDLQIRKDLTLNRVKDGTREQCLERNQGLRWKLEQGDLLPDIQLGHTSLGPLLSSSSPLLLTPGWTTNPHIIKLKSRI